MTNDCLFKYDEEFVLFQNISYLYKRCTVPKHLEFLMSGIFLYTVFIDRFFPSHLYASLILISKIQSHYKISTAE